MINRESVFWIRCGALLGGLAVILGAFAAHLLEGVLETKYPGVKMKFLGQEVPTAQRYLADFKTAAEYQMYHALALLAVGLLPVPPRTRSVNVAGWSFLLGIVFFSGSLYLLVLTGITKLGAVTPIGGVFFLIGWGAFAVAAGRVVTRGNG